MVFPGARDLHISHICTICILSISIRYHILADQFCICWPAAGTLESVEESTSLCSQVIGSWFLQHDQDNGRGVLWSTESSLHWRKKNGLGKSYWSSFPHQRTWQPIDIFPQWQQCILALRILFQCLGVHCPLRAQGECSGGCAIIPITKDFSLYHQLQSICDFTNYYIFNER